jgi:hypothetical protein
MLLGSLANCTIDQAQQPSVKRVTSPQQTVRCYDTHVSVVRGPTGTMRPAPSDSLRGGERVGSTHDTRSPPRTAQASCPALVGRVPG